MTDNGDVQLAQPLPITKQAFHFPCYLPQQAEESDGEPVVIRMECLPLSSMQIIALHLLWKITVNLCLHSYRTQFLHTHTHTNIKTPHVHTQKHTLHSSPAPVSSGTLQVWKCRPEWNLSWAGKPGGSCARTGSSGGGSSLQQSNQRGKKWFGINIFLSIYVHLHTLFLQCRTICSFSHCFECNWRSSLDQWKTVSQLSGDFKQLENVKKHQSAWQRCSTEFGHRLQAAGFVDLFPKSELSWKGRLRFHLKICCTSKCSSLDLYFEIKSGLQETAPAWLKQISSGSTEGDDGEMMETH